MNSKELYAICEEIVQMLEINNWSIATAESCTAGLIAGTLVDVPGASNVFNEGYITYSNDAKIKLARVHPETLELHGAVSEEVAMEMAKGAALAAFAHVGVSATGIAGPQGGTVEKPVGLVYIGCYIGGHQSVLKCNFSGNRRENRLATVSSALELVRDEMKAQLKA